MNHPESFQARLLTCFFTGTSEDDHGFRGIGMVKFKLEEVTDGSAK